MYGFCLGGLHRRGLLWMARIVRAGNVTLRRPGRFKPPSITDQTMNVLGRVDECGALPYGSRQAIEHDPCVV